MGEKINGFFWTGLQAVQRRMEDMVMKFVARLVLTKEEQRVIVIDDKECALLRANRVFLVGRMLSYKLVNNERFKCHMVNLWRPKAKVTIVEIDDRLFSLGFESIQECSLVQKGGPWLYDGALLVMAEADSLAHPASILLKFQEFWIQVKGLPLAYMTRHMGQFIGNQIGVHILTDQSRKGDLFGSIMRIRVEIDILKPLRRSLLLSFQGMDVRIDLRYEKLLVTCFICGIFGHMEEQCDQFQGKKMMMIVRNRMDDGSKRMC